MSEVVKYCTFAEWFHRHALDDKNGGYYMHFKSGMEVNKPYNIVEIFKYYNDKLTPTTKTIDNGNNNINNHCLGNSESHSQ